jgi:multicomponent K+:H+ antiporter subunit D
VLPVAALLAACLALTLMAEPVMQHASATAQGLRSPGAYREAVLGARQRPGPTTEAAGDTAP